MNQEQEYHIASFVAHCHPKHVQQVAKLINEKPNMEVHAISEEGKIVFTAEATTQHAIANTTDTIKQYQGMLTLSPVYHQFLTEKNAS